MVASPSTVGTRDRVRVLVSDQDAGARQALKRSLQPGHWELYEVESGREALQVFRTHVVHVLVSAVELPDTTGFNLAWELRQEAGARGAGGLPFVLTVYDLRKETLLRALVARAFTVLQKPIDGWMFRTTLEHLVGRCYRGGVPRSHDEGKNAWRQSAREEDLL
jgi:two-component system cell cycle response regulator